MILLVDDDNIICNLYKNVFTDKDVLIFDKPEEAISYIDNNHVSVIVTDYMMPVKGDVLCEIAKKKNPVTKTILCSGYHFVKYNEEFVDLFIEKPMNFKKLKEIIKNFTENENTSITN
mgnify:CR=1 FL=1